MTPNDLDLARAKVLLWHDTGDPRPATPELLEYAWEHETPLERQYWVDAAQASRLGDEARGMRVVPVGGDGEEGMTDASRALDRAARAFGALPDPADWNGLRAAVRAAIEAYNQEMEHGNPAGIHRDRDRAGDCVQPQREGAVSDDQKALIAEARERASYINNPRNVNLLRRLADALERATLEKKGRK